MIYFKRTTLYGKSGIQNMKTLLLLLFRVLNTVEGSTEIPEEV